MSRKKLFTYFDHCPEIDVDAEWKLINLWMRHHTALGFTTYVLRPWHAKKYPGYALCHEAYKNLPSVNPHNYDVACFDRWIAMSVIAGDHAIMADYDTFLTPSVWDDLNPLLELTNGLRVFQGHCPCLVVGNARTFLTWALRFSDFKADGMRHTSDQNILEHYAKTEPQSYERFNYVKLHGEPGWETAPAVHYANAVMVPADHIPRCEWIPKLRPYTVPNQ